MKRNFTSVTEFILLGLTSHVALQILFFLCCFWWYMWTQWQVTCSIKANVRFHTVMYFFLSHLSFVDMSFSSSVTPNMLQTFVSESKTISYPAYLVQCYLFIALVHVEIYILALMAFVCYMAIWNPLLYGSKMSQSVCTSLITVPYVYGALTGLMETIWTDLAFCGHNGISHFYCADPPLIKRVKNSDPKLLKMYRDKNREEPEENEVH